MFEIFVVAAFHPVAVSCYFLPMRLHLHYTQPQSENMQSVNAQGPGMRSLTYVSPTAQQQCGNHTPTAPSPFSAAPLVACSSFLFFVFFFNVKKNKKLKTLKNWIEIYLMFMYGKRTVTSRTTS